MEPENALDLGMIHGQLVTISGMRMDSRSPFLPMAKLESAIESLQRSRASLMQARDEIGRVSYNATIDQVDEYLVRVWDELDILETQHSILLQEVVDIPPDTQQTYVATRPAYHPTGLDTNRPKFEVPTVLPAVPFTMNTAEQAELEKKWIGKWEEGEFADHRTIQGEIRSEWSAQDVPDWFFGTNLEKLMERGKRWKLPMTEWLSMRDLCLLKGYGPAPLQNSGQELRQLKQQFWTVPNARFAVACLIYHYYCRRDDGTIVGSQKFRAWAIEVLTVLMHPVEFRELLLMLPNVPIWSEKDLGLPMKNGMEQKLIALIWLSLTKDDQLGLRSLMNCVGVETFSRYIGWMVWYQKIWEEDVQ